MMIDVDHFKRFDDTFGHKAGDHVLRELGALLMRSKRSSDVACRYGGEEFVLLLPESPLESTMKVAEALRCELARMRVEHDGLSLGTITISVGVAEFPTHARDADQLLGHADEALYAAKHGGRNRVVAYVRDQQVAPTRSPFKVSMHFRARN